jgi:hypothetical protein
MPRCARRNARDFVHAVLEVVPSGLRDLDVLTRQLCAALAQDVEKHEEIPEAAVEDAVEIASVVTAQLAKCPFDLGAVRERKRGRIHGETVQSVDLDIERRRCIGTELVQELRNGLVTFGIPVVHGLRRRHQVPPLRPIWSVSNAHVRQMQSEPHVVAQAPRRSLPEAP